MTLIEARKELGRGTLVKICQRLGILITENNFDALAHQYRLQKEGNGLNSKDIFSIIDSIRGEK